MPSRLLHKSTLHLTARQLGRQCPASLQRTSAQAYNHTLRLTALLALLLSLPACVRPTDTRQTITFWSFGREGEAVQELVPEFERRNPDVKVVVQQIPWTAAHEKLLTAFVGDAMPDLAQLGNTWVPEFHLLGALEPLDSLVAASEAIDRTDFFDGIWQTNVLDGVTYGLPWYVDTRLLFYRT
ncbi:MAG TPA: extracellular solute-binding protein, partial [Rhodothermales bacterium]